MQYLRFFNSDHQNCCAYPRNKLFFFDEAEILYIWKFESSVQDPLIDYRAMKRRRYISASEERPSRIEYLNLSAIKVPPKDRQNSNFPVKLYLY